MSSRFSIRTFQYPQDYPAVLNLWESMEKGVHVGRSDAPQEIEKKIRRDPDLFLVAESKGRVIGSVIGGFDGRRGIIYHLAVAGPHRHRGVANRLMDEVESRLRAKGCLRCYLLVQAGNEEAENFYAQRGWVWMDSVRPYSKDLV